MEVGVTKKLLGPSQKMLWGEPGSFLLVDSLRPLGPNDLRGILVFFKAPIWKNIILKILLSLHRKIHYFHGVTYTFFYFANLRKRVYTYRTSICNFNKKVFH